MPAQYLARPAFLTRGSLPRQQQTRYPGQHQQHRWPRSCRSGALNQGAPEEAADSRSGTPAGDPSAAAAAQQQAGEGGSSSSGAKPQAPAAPAVVGAAQFMAGTTAGNAAQAALGVALGDWQGLNVSGQLLQGSVNWPAALAFMLPLFAACYYGVSSADQNEGFDQMRRLFKQTLIPQLQVLPHWGLALLALGAGVGEETLFRALLQTAAINSISGAAPALPSAAASAVGVAAASVFFGALHALTPTYFIFATVAGVLFGIEYLACGLPTASATHFLYDWAALTFVLQQWGSGSKNASEEQSK